MQKIGGGMGCVRVKGLCIANAPTNSIGIANADERRGTYTTSDGSYFKGSFYKGQPEHGAWYDKNGKKLTEM